MPAGPADVQVVDRPAWVAANIASFRRLLGPLLSRWEERVGSRAGVANEVTSRVAAVELGSLLGWMSGRVLGQYDLLLSDQPGGDVVYLVGPNLIGLERRFDFPPDQFRLWVLLHELTHRAQFTGVPWMAAHFSGLVERALTVAEPDARQLAGAARALMQDRAEARRRLDEGGMLALVASPEQRATLNEIGGMMALLEGHGDVTMDRAGAGRVLAAKRFCLGAVGPPPGRLAAGAHAAQADRPREQAQPVRAGRALHRPHRAGGRPARRRRLLGGSGAAAVPGGDPGAPALGRPGRSGRRGRLTGPGRP